MSSFMDHLKCPICFEIPEGKVYQCKNGHTFCSQCSPRLKACPQCRVILGFERIRNRSLEQILDATKFGCPNKELGCARVLSRAEISSHLLYCKFEPFYFCKLIGFQNCSYNAIRSLHGYPSDLLEHLRDTHSEIQQTVVDAQNGRLLLNYESFLCRANTLEKSAVTIWTPHLLKVKHSRENNAEVQDDENESLLLILCQISEHTRNAAWICLCMTTDMEAGSDQRIIDVNSGNGASASSKASNSSFVIQYQIKGQRGSELINIVDQVERTEEDEHYYNELGLLTPMMTWKAPVLTFKNIDKELESYALRIPICVLNSFKNGRGDLEIGITLEFNASHSSTLFRCLTSPRSISISPLTSFIANTTTLSSPKPQCPTYCIKYAENGGDGDDGNENEENQVVFANVYCNGCGQRPMVRIRYKCLQCVDYDLCKECIDRGDTHMHHVFARIHSLRQSELFSHKHRQRMLKGRSGFI